MSELDGTDQKFDHYPRLKRLREYYLLAVRQWGGPQM